MALVQFSAFCAPVAAKGRAEWFAAPAQSCVLHRQARVTQKRQQSTRRTGQVTLPFEVIRFSAWASSSPGALQEEGHAESGHDLRPAPCPWGWDARQRRGMLRKVPWECAELLCHPGALQRSFGHQAPERDAPGV